MTPKKERLLEEKKMLTSKIATYEERIQKAKSRISEIDVQVTSITNSEYGKVLEAYHMTPEQLAEFLQNMKKKGKDE